MPAAHAAKGKGRFRRRHAKISQGPPWGPRRQNPWIPKSRPPAGQERAAKMQKSPSSPRDERLIIAFRGTTHSSLRCCRPTLDTTVSSCNGPRTPTPTRAFALSDGNSGMFFPCRRRAGFQLPRLSVCTGQAGYFFPSSSFPLWHALDAKRQQAPDLFYSIAACRPLCNPFFRKSGGRAKDCKKERKAMWDSSAF